MGKKRGKGKAAKKARKNLISEEEQYLTEPHSFVINRGKLGPKAFHLLTDFRKVLEPYTASSLKVRRRNKVRDFVSVASCLNVTHLVVFTKTQRGVYLRLGRLPQGPTLIFQVLGYSLSGEVAAAQRRPFSLQTLFLNPPLVVLNNLQSSDKSPDPTRTLVHSMWRSLFPNINYTTVKLNSVRRTVFVDYDENTEVLSFRHYGVKLVPTTLTRPVKKIIKRDVPNLNKYVSYEDYLEKAILSESEVDEAPNAQVELQQEVATRGALVGEKVSPRMVELGPRLDLKLVKIEAELMQGEVLYHRLVAKTEEEKKQALKRKKERLRLQASRKKQQNKLKTQKEQSEKVDEKEKQDDSLPARQGLKRKSQTISPLPAAKKNKILLERRKRLMLKKKKTSVA